MEKDSLGNCVKYFVMRHREPWMLQLCKRAHVDSPRMKFLALWCIVKYDDAIQQFNENWITEKTLENITMKLLGRMCASMRLCRFRRISATVLAATMQCAQRQQHTKKEQRKLEMGKKVSVFVWQDNEKFEEKFVVFLLPCTSFCDGGKSSKNWQQ